MKTTLHSVTWKKKKVSFIALRHSKSNCVSTTLKNVYKKNWKREMERTGRGKREKQMYCTLMFSFMSITFTELHKS
jgi:hypothetical protein